MVPHPPVGRELSTGTPRGSERRRDGVEVPGVAGGVKAGETSEAGGWKSLSGFWGEGDEERVEAARSVSRSWLGALDAGVDRCCGAGFGVADEAT